MCRIATAESVGSGFAVLASFTDTDPCRHEMSGQGVRLLESRGEQLRGGLKRGERVERYDGRPPDPLRSLPMRCR